MPGRIQATAVLCGGYHGTMWGTVVIINQDRFSTNILFRWGTVQAGKQYSNSGPAPPLGTQSSSIEKGESDFLKFSFSRGPEGTE